MEKIKIDFGRGEFLLDLSSHDFDNQINSITYELFESFGRTISTNGCPSLWQSIFAQFQALIERFKAELSSGKDVSWFKPKFTKYSLLFAAFSTFSRNDDYTSEAFEEAKHFHDSGFQSALIEAGAVFRSCIDEANQLLGMSAQSKRRDACIVFIDTLITHFDFSLDYIVNSNQDNNEEIRREFLKELNNILNRPDLLSDFDIKSTWDLLIRQVQEKASQVIEMAAINNRVENLVQDFTLTKTTVEALLPLGKQWGRKKNIHGSLLVLFALILGYLICFGIRRILEFNVQGCCEDAKTWVDLFQCSIEKWNIERSLLLLSIWAWLTHQTSHFFRSQWHLFNDSYERVVMIESYEKLHSEHLKSGDKEASNKALFMMFSAILRQADDGLMKDSPKPSLIPIDFIKFGKE